MKSRFNSLLDIIKMYIAMQLDVFAMIYPTYLKDMLEYLEAYE